MTQRTPSDDEKAASYTTARLDIAKQVPEDALYILDVGCSTGELGAHLKALEAGRIVDGIENEPSFSSRAAEKLDRIYQIDLNTSQLSAEISARYDCIIFADILEHLTDPEQTLKEALKLLSTRGWVIICVPNIRHATAFWSIFIKGTFPQRQRGLFDKTHLRWFTRNDLHTLATKAGLTQIKISSNIRLFDRPGGRTNRWLQRKSKFINKIPLLCELLGYQHILVARIAK